MTLGMILATIFTVGWMPLFFIRAESMHDALAQYHRNERVAVVLSAVVMSLHVTFTCLTAILTDAILPGPAAVSVGIFLAGITFWVWARIMIGPLFTRRLPDEVPFELRRHGAFGLVRNPLYFGCLVAAGAPLVALPRIFLFLSFALCCAALAVRAVQDEARLLAQVGAPYESYCREVKRLVPFVW